MKIDLKKLREAMVAWQDRPALFCDECGETEPESKFYPLGIFGPDSMSGSICNDCEKQMREEIQGE